MYVILSLSLYLSIYIYLYISICIYIYTQTSNFTKPLHSHKLQSSCSGHTLKDYVCYSVCCVNCIPFCIMDYGSRRLSCKLYTSVLLLYNCILYTSVYTV